MTKVIRITVGSLIAAGLAFASANAAEHTLKAVLDSKQEVPANTSAGKGTGEITINDATKEITWKVTFEGLSGDVTAAHIHGPATAGANAGVMVNFGMAPFKSPIEGKGTVTDAQIADILAGRAYVNLHTVANKGGEIRGQISK
jgi:Cu/Zn superoxide dismutase